MRCVGIGEKGSKKISLLCNINDFDHNGNAAFYVINGDWYGVLFANGTVLVKQTKAKIPNQTILWEGTTPTELLNYNDVIPWIEAQLNSCT